MVLNCEEVRRELSNYLDGGVDAALPRCAAVESHLAACPRCASLLAGMRNVVHLVGDERAFPLPAGFHGRLRQLLAPHIHRAPDVIRPIPFPLPALRGAKQSRSGNRFTTSLVWATAAATLLAAFSLTRAQYPNSWRPKSWHSQPAIRVPIAQVAIDPKGKLFHVAQCTYLTGQSQIVSAAVAVREGYTPCVRCEGELLKHKPQEEESAKLPEERLAQGGLEISALRRE